LDASVNHCIVVLPRAGYFKERLVAIISIAKETANTTPLALFEDPEKQVHDAEIQLIRSRVCERLPLYMIPTVWIAVGSLPQLTSGKIDRKLAMQWLTSMGADTYQRIIAVTDQGVESTHPTSDIEVTLRSVWAHVLNLPEEQVSYDRAFLSLGGDSISAMQVMGQCRKRGIGLGVQDILRSRSILQLAAAVKEVKASYDNVIEEVEKPFDLSPIQSLWFQLPNQGHGHFNQSFYLRVKRHVTAEQFRLAIDTLVSRHSMLRSRFTCSSEHVWQQRVTEDVVTSYRFRHESVSTKGEVDVMIEDSQKCLDHSQGPLLAVDLYEFGTEQHAFLTACHLVIDLVTWRLLLEELEEILKGETLLPPALSFQSWCQLQKEHADTLSLEKVLPPVDIPSLDFSYWGISHADNTYGNARHESFELDSSDTSLFLGACHNALKTEPVEVLLASLIHSWYQVFNDRALPAIFNEGHGREPWSSDIDIARTVGWFTTGNVFWRDARAFLLTRFASVSRLRNSFGNLG
jgi:aryl carrier-like protein